MTTLEYVLQNESDHVNLFAAGVKIGEVGAIQLQAHIRTHPRLSLLELKGSILGRRGCEHLCHAMRNHPGLRHLGLGRCSLDKEAAVSVMRTLATTQLQTLDLEWNGLSDGVALAIADYIKSSSTILSISLERNDIRSDGAAAIAEALCTNKSLRNLNLAFNKVGGQACEAFRKALLVNTTLLTLNLSQNAIYSDGASMLVEGLLKNRTLLSINLQSNQAVESFAALGKAMDYGPVLKELNFGSNRFPSMIAGPFAEGLRSATGLIGLSLAKCQIGEPHIRLLLDAVACLTQLQTIDLSNTLISMESGESLANMLVRCPNLAHVTLDDNRLGSHGAAKVGEALRSCACLTALSVNNCSLGPHGAASIADGLKKKKGLPMSDVRMRSNRIQNYGCLALCAALTYMLGEGEGSLEELDLADGNLITGESCQFLARVLFCNTRLQCVTVRNNQIAEDVQASYLDFEKALTFTSGVIGDPAKEQLAMAAHETKSTFSVNKDEYNAAPRTNFNGTSESYYNSNEFESNSILSNEAQSLMTDGNASNQSLGYRGRLLASAMSGPLAANSSAAARSGSPSASKVGAIQRATDVYSPGETPTVPVIKRRHELHRVDENVGLLPITETQLRQKFSELDRNNDGYLDAEEFARVYSSFQLVTLDDNDKHLRPLVQKYSKNGKIYFEGFSILMLRLVNT